MIFINGAAHATKGLWFNGWKLNPLGLISSRSHIQIPLMCRVKTSSVSSCTTFLGLDSEDIHFLNNSRSLVGVMLTRLILRAGCSVHLCVRGWIWKSDVAGGSKIITTIVLLFSAKRKIFSRPFIFLFLPTFLYS